MFRRTVFILAAGLLTANLVSANLAVPAFAAGDDPASADPASAPPVSCANGVPGGVNCLATKKDLKEARNAFREGVQLEQQSA